MQRLSVKRNTSQTDQAGKYFLLTFERALFGWAGFSWWWCTQGIFLHWLLHIYIYELKNYIYELKNYIYIYIQEPIIIISIFICSPCGSRHFFFWLKNFYPRAFETDSHFPWGTLKEKTHFLPQPNKNSAFPLSQCEGPN